MIEAVHCNKLSSRSWLIISGDDALSGTEHLSLLSAYWTLNSGYNSVWSWEVNMGVLLKS